jgi:hypothetical protein
VLVRKDESHTGGGDMMQRGDQNQNVLSGNRRDAMPRADVKHHDGEGSEIEGDVVVESSSWRYGNGASRSAVNQVRQADVPKVGVLKRSIPSVQPVIQDPGQVGPMGYAEDFGRGLVER